MMPSSPTQHNGGLLRSVFVLLLASASAELHVRRVESVKPVTPDVDLGVVSGLRSRIVKHHEGHATNSSGALTRLRPLPAGGRNLATALQDPDCPIFADSLSLFGNSDVNENIAGWMTTEDGSSNFIQEMVRLYVNENVVGAKGADITDRDGEFSEVCARLPLDDDSCYFVQNPDASFLDTLLADLIPFYQHIVDAKAYVNGLIEDVEDQAEDIYNFFLPDREPDGSCFVVNEDMIGIVDVPGLPPPWVYEVCNCLSIRSTGVPACIVQPYFTGFALSTGANNALKFDISDRLGGDFYLYDGYLQYKFVPRGDIWAGLDFEVKVPKLSAFNPANLVCVPSDGSKPTKLKVPELNMKTSLLIQNDLDSPRGELLILVAIEELNLVVAELFEISMGSAVAAMRVRSADPDCQPSGLFFSINVETNFGLGEGLEKFVGQIVSNPSIDIDFGVTWKDDEPPDADDVIQSIFYRMQLQDFDFLGWSVDSATIEIQYFDDEEFARRRNFQFESCCSKPGVTDCTVPNQPLKDFIENGLVQEKSTVGMFLDVQDLSFLGGIVNFSVDVSVLYIADIKITVYFLDLPEGSIAEFSASIDLNVGLGVLAVSLEAKAAIGEFEYSPNRRHLLEAGDPRALQTKSGGSLLDADWDLDFSTDWQTAQWLEDLGKAIVEGLKILAEAIVFVWNAIVEFVEVAWEAIKDLAAAIGGAIAQVFDAIGEALDAASEAITEGIDAAVDFLNGKGALGDLAAGVLDVLGDVAEFALDRLGDAVDLAAGIFRGDWKAAGEAAANLFGFSKSVSGKKEVVVDGLDEVFGCPRRRQEWEECSRAFFVEYDCKTKRSPIYLEESCAKRKAAEIEKLKEDSELAKKQNECKEGSQNRNQGLNWAGEQEDAVLRETLGATMSAPKLNIGKTSSLQSCKTVPYTVSVETLAPSAAGVAGKNNGNAASTQCVDFSDAASLGASLDSFRNEVAETAKDVSRGNQGLDKDTEVAGCGDIADATCSVAPRLVTGTDFKLTETVTCDIDWATFSLASVFGGAALYQDDLCPDKPVEFQIIGIADPPEDGCAPVTMTIERTATDCCGNVVQNPITHTLVIESLPPEFTQEPGSMDVELACDANIHPRLLGEPTFVPGCRDALASLNAVDDSVFDVDTCTTKVTRKFTVDDNDCMDLSDEFIQTITLTNDYLPQWDFFPADVTVGVFDSYGAEALGYPTVFQQCGASPVSVTYSDAITQGACFAERVLTRTFTATDICGHVSERSQIITITNDPAALPLADKSLASIYGRDRARIGNENQICLWDSDDCGVFGAPTDYQCETAPDDEFSGYQSFLQGLEGQSLDLGPTETSCACTVGDASCDQIQQKMDLNVYFTEFVYGTQVVTSSGTCNIVSLMEEGNQAGTYTTGSFDCPELPDNDNNGGGNGNGNGNGNEGSTPDETPSPSVSTTPFPSMSPSSSSSSVPTPSPTLVETGNGNGNSNGNSNGGGNGNSNGGGNGNSNGNNRGANEVFDRRRLQECEETQLIGTDPVYNFFSVPAEDIADNRIYINAPATSIVLINVENLPGQNITVAATTEGVFLDGGITANNVLWNIVGGLNVKHTRTARPEYSWHGTMLNSNGEMQLTLSQNAENFWRGQLFCDNLNSNSINFECGHFSGFAACA